jgi:hypothetical protein
MATPSSSGITTHAEDRKDGLKVDPFYGNGNKIDTFLIQLKVVFKLNPTKYATGEQKVMYAAMQLKGDAFSWFKHTLDDFVSSDTPDKDTKDCFRQFAEFETRLRKIFGAMSKERAAARTIYSIKQKGSAAQYYSEFHQVASELNWTDEDAFAEIFYNGLKKSVRQEMMDPPNTYEKMVEEAIRIDNRLWELRLEDGGPQKNDYHRYQAKGHHFRPRNDRYGDPMDLDLMHQGKGLVRGRNQPRGGRGGRASSDRERERQRKENLCYSCGKPGHRARDCKTAQGLHMMSDDITGMEAKKADTFMKTLRTSDSQGTAQKDHHESDAKGMGESEDHEALYKAMNTLDATREKYGHGSEEAEDLTYEQACQGEIPPPKSTMALAEACQEATKEKPIDYAAGFKYLDAAEHAMLSWTACYDDSCTTHYSDKMGTGWFPQEPKARRNRRNKKSKKLQEALAQGTDPHDQPGFWMMTDGIPPPPKEPEEKNTFMVLHMTDRELVMVTPHWRAVDCWREECRYNMRHRHRIFDPREPPKAPVMVTMTLCQKEECPVKGTHAHQGKKDDDVSEIEVPAEAREQLDRLNEEYPMSFSMMNQEDPDDVETSETEGDQDTDELPLTQEDDSNEVSTYVQKVTTDGCTLVTTQWTKEACKDEICPHGAQHAHIVFDDDAEPSKYIKRIRLQFCRGTSCEEKGIHAHQLGYRNVIQIQVTPEKEKAMRESWENPQEFRQSETLSMMVDNIAALEPVIDERYDKDLIGEKFWCHQLDCPKYHTIHSHLHNVDPNFPQVPITPAACEEMIAEGMMCEEQQCQWRMYLHVHFSPQSFDMMVGDKLNPEIVENVVDNRVDEEFIAEYFGCEEKCERTDTHTHLYHIDPRQPNDAILPDHFAKLQRCAEMRCSWQEYEHVHLPKNDKVVTR